MFVDIIINLVIKLMDIFISNNKRKQKMLETLESFMEQFRETTARNVVIKRRYDEQLDELRRKREGTRGSKSGGKKEV